MDNRLPSVPESAQDRDVQLRYGVAQVLLVSVDCVRPALVDSHAAMMPYLNVPIPDSCRRQYVELASGHQLGPPKSRAGSRTIAIPRPITAALAEHMETYVPGEDTALIFTGALGGVLRRGLGVPGLHFHDLRHTGNTLAAQSGVSRPHRIYVHVHAGPRQHVTGNWNDVCSLGSGAGARWVRSAELLPSGTGS
jgi:hypothetical protein